MRSLFSRVPDCGGNVVTGTQVHNQVRDTTTGSSSQMTTMLPMLMYQCKHEQLASVLCERSFGTIRYQRPRRDERPSRRREKRRLTTCRPLG